MVNLKKKYNYILNRYYNGCNYIEANPQQFNKYIYTVMDLKKQLEDILNKIEKQQQISEDEILGGFRVC